MRFRGSVEAAAVVVGAVLLACVFTYPYVVHFTNGGRLDTNDGRFSIWVVAWVTHALTTAPSELYNANIFYPHTNTLAFSEAEIFEGVLGAPVWWLTENPYTTHNFVFLFGFAQSFVATYYLIRRLTGDRLAAIVAGVLFAYCPFAFNRQPHIQLVMIGFLPWCMLAWHRFLDRTTIARAIELGTVMAMTGLACAYYGIFAGGMISMAAIWFAVSRKRLGDIGYWAALALAAVICLALIGPFFWPYIELQRTEGFQRSLSGQYSANIGAWLASSAWAHRWWVPYLDAPSEVLFPGILAIVLGVSGARLALRSPLRDVAAFYIALALFTVWLTFGPEAGLYTFLYRTVPVLSFLRAPSRAGIVVTLCLVILAAPAMIAIMQRRGRNAAFAVLLALAVLDLFRAPLRMREAPPLPSAYRVLAQSPRGPVVELPFWHDGSSFHGHVEYMLNSTAHWQPLINGYSDHIPQDFRDNSTILATFPSASAFTVLESLGARYAVIHFDLMDPSSRPDLIRRLDVDYANYLRPLDKNGSVWLYEIVSWPR
jgi:hypothetical protein